MELGAVLKQAWQITWRYKILWVFGLFAGGLSGGASGVGSPPSGVDDASTDPYKQFEQIERIQERLFENLEVLIALGAILLLLGLVLWVVSIAARGGLIQLVYDAEQGREVRGANGWSTGFRMWGRVFLLDLVLFLPFIIFAVLIGLVAFGPVVAAAIQGSDPSPAVVQMCGGILIGVVLLFFVGIFVELLHELGIRHAIIANQPALKAIGLAWGNVRSRFKDVFLMWLILFGLSIAFGMAVGVIGVLSGLMMLVPVLGGAWLVAVFIGFVSFLVLLLPASIFSTFSSAVWTLFYRRLTAPDAADSIGGTVSPPMPSGGFIPPAPASPPQSSMPAPPSDG